MADLNIDDLVVEYSSGGYAVRPIDGLNLDVTAGSLGAPAGSERVREDDAAVVSRRHPAPDLGPDHFRRCGRHRT